MFTKAAALLKEWMQDAGLDVWMDEIGNIRGKTPTTLCNDGPALLMGSHFDTVRDGGKYDGMLGILNAISAVKALILDVKSKQGLKLMRPVEVIAFGDEEGGRFFSRFISSRALTGDLVATNDLQEYKDDDGKTLAQVLDENGLDGSTEVVANAIYDPKQIYAFVETHIEQG